MRFDDLPPGKTYAHLAIRPDRSTSVIVVAGATTETTLELAGGMTVMGIVVDPAGAPVGDATVEASMPAMSSELAVAATTAADGTFCLRECDEHTVVGARAPGHAASIMHLVEGKPGTVERVRIQLRPAGGAVAGRVVDREGRPIADAVVRIGDGRREAILVTEQGGPPAPAQAITDADGRFFTIGVAAGPQHVQAIAVDMSPWSGSCDVAAGLTTSIPIVMVPGVTCRGTVRSADGKPLPSIRVRLGRLGDFTLRSTRSVEDGTFTLTGLPVGEFTLAAADPDLGSGSTLVYGEAGAIVACEIVLGTHAVLRGRVLDADGNAVAGVQVDVDGRNGTRRWSAHASTDAQGHFTIGGCPDGTLTARIGHRDHLPLQRGGVRPGADEVVLRLERDTSQRCRIVGRLCWPDARPALAERITASRADAKMPVEEAIVAADGTFALEVSAGLWGVHCRMPKFADLRVPPRSLLPGTTWDLGTLTLARGGTLVVTTDTTPAPSCTITTPAGEFVAGLSSPHLPQRSDTLVPGDYVLLVHADGAAAQAVPFTICEEQETALHVQATPGVRQRFLFAQPPGGELPAFVTCRVECDGKVVALLASSGEPIDGQLPATVWLAPGSYTVMTLYRALVSETSFAVTAQEAGPVVIGLR